MNSNKSTKVKDRKINAIHNNNIPKFGKNFVMQKLMHSCIFVVYLI